MEIIKNISAAKSTVISEKELGNGHYAILVEKE